MKKKANMSSMTTPGKGTKAKRSPYNTPVLITFGHVKTLTQSTGSVNGDGGQNMMPVMEVMTMSDPLLKENLVRIGSHPLGIGLYLFDYKPEYRDACGYGRQFGVMADEVEEIMPEAVSVHSNGYKMVDYALLGITHASR